MNFITAYSALLVAGLSAMATAELGVGPMLPSYDSSTMAAIPYWTDEEYTDVQMQLVVKNPAKFETGWNSYEIIFHTEHVAPSGNATFSWHVREVPEGLEYGIWISALDTGTPWAGGNITGYSALSNWFEIHNTPKEAVLSPGEIVGIIVPVLVLFALVAGVVLFVRRRRRASRTTRQMAPADWRDSADTIALEKDRVRAAMSETKA